MDAQRIQYLSQFIPRSSDYFRYSLGTASSHVSSNQPEIDRFLIAYKDLSFGYHFVRSLVKEGVNIPPDVFEPEILDFYWYERSGHSSPSLIHALSLHHPSNQFMENAVQALLLSDASLQDIAKTAGISYEVLRYYEQLFFNVRDRRDESLFIASVVYPEHRLVETMEGYIRDVDAGSFLKRAAFNNGLDDAAYFVGLRVEDIDAANSSNAREMASRLESSIMANGYYLARNGFLNQRSAQGLNAARGLIIAAKQGGEDSAELDTFGAGSLGDALVEELQKVKGGEMLERIKQQQNELETYHSRDDNDYLSDEDALNDN